jgi:DNA-binding NarL/FixJ family response regulator
MLSLWIIDDNLALLRSLDLAFQGDYQIQIFSDPASCLLALQAPRTRKPDILLTDLEMEGMTGLEMLEEIAAEYPQIRTYLLSSGLTREIMIKAYQLGVRGCVGKPFDLGELKRMLEA